MRLVALMVENTTFDRLSTVIMLTKSQTHMNKNKEELGRILLYFVNLCDPTSWSAPILNNSLIKKRYNSETLIK